MLSSHDINRRHSLNTHFFDTIHNEEQAYWLGFLWADGSWSKTAPRCSGPNRLTLSQKLSEIKVESPTSLLSMIICTKMPLCISTQSINNS